MGKHKVLCHICSHITRAPQEQEVPKICVQCFANIQDTTAETVLHSVSTTVYFSTPREGKEPKVAIKKGVLALTNSRLVFVEERDNTFAWVVGGLIGSLIASLFPSKKTRPFFVIEREDIVSYTSDITGVLKGTLLITLQLKNGNTQVITVPKKEEEKWLPEFDKNVVVSL